MRESGEDVEGGEGESDGWVAPPVARAPSNRRADEVAEVRRRCAHAHGRHRTLTGRVETEGAPGHRPPRVDEDEGGQEERGHPDGRADRPHERDAGGSGEREPDEKPARARFDPAPEEDAAGEGGE